MVNLCELKQMYSAHVKLFVFVCKFVNMPNIPKKEIACIVHGISIKGSRRRSFPKYV